MKSAPRITGADESEPVDVGVGAPIVYIDTIEADYCTIELKNNSNANNPWVKYYVGALMPTIMFGVPIDPIR